MKSTTSLINDDSQSLVCNAHDVHAHPSAPPVFVLCDRCYRCATYFSNARMPTDNICPLCNSNNNELTSFPVAPNESFTYNYNEKRRVELEFKDRRSL